MSKKGITDEDLSALEKVKRDIEKQRRKNRRNESDTNSEFSDIHVPEFDHLDAFLLALEAEIAMAAGGSSQPQEPVQVLSRTAVISDDSPFPLPERLRQQNATDPTEKESESHMMSADKSSAVKGSKGSVNPSDINYKKETHDAKVSEFKQSSLIQLPSKLPVKSDKSSSTWSEDDSLEEQKMDSPQKGLNQKGQEQTVTHHGKSAVEEERDIADATRDEILTTKKLFVKVDEPTSSSKTKLTANLNEFVEQQTRDQGLKETKLFKPDPKVEVSTNSETQKLATLTDQSPHAVDDVTSSNTVEDASRISEQRYPRLPVKVQPVQREEVSLTPSTARSSFSSESPREIVKQRKKAAKRKKTKLPKWDNSIDWKHKQLYRPKTESEDADILSRLQLQSPKDDHHLDPNRMRKSRWNQKGARRTTISSQLKLRSRYNSISVEEPQFDTKLERRSSAWSQFEGRLIERDIMLETQKEIDDAYRLRQISANIWSMKERQFVSRYVKVMKGKTTGWKKEGNEEIDSMLEKVWRKKARQTFRIFIENAKRNQFEIEDSVQSKVELYRAGTLGIALFSRNTAFNWFCALLACFLLELLLRGTIVKFGG